MGRSDNGALDEERGKQQGQQEQAALVLIMYERMTYESGPAISIMMTLTPHSAISSMYAVSSEIDAFECGEVVSSAHVSRGSEGSRPPHQEVTGH